MFEIGSQNFQVVSLSHLTFEAYGEDLVEDSEKSWTNPTTSGPLWPLIEKTESRGNILDAKSTKPVAVATIGEFYIQQTNTGRVLGEMMFHYVAIAF